MRGPRSSVDRWRGVPDRDPRCLHRSTSLPPAWDPWAQTGQTVEYAGDIRSRIVGHLDG